MLFDCLPYGLRRFATDLDSPINVFLDGDMKCDDVCAEVSISWWAVHFCRLAPTQNVLTCAFHMVDLGEALLFNCCVTTHLPRLLVSLGGLE